MKTYRVKSDAELFQKWANTSALVRTISAIVQNDGEYSQEEMNRWFKESEEIILDAARLLNETVNHLKNNS